MERIGNYEFSDKGSTPFRDTILIYGCIVYRLGHEIFILKSVGFNSPYSHHTGSTPVFKLIPCKTVLPMFAAQFDSATEQVRLLLGLVQ